MDNFFIFSVASLSGSWLTRLQDSIEIYFPYACFQVKNKTVEFAWDALRHEECHFTAGLVNLP